jgi:hypothetical protein
MRHYSTTTFSSSDHNISQKGSVALYANQNVDGAYPTGLADIEYGQTQAWSNDPQAMVDSQILYSMQLAKI